MPRSRLSDPLRRPQFRRLATSFALNELGDWMGIVALSVLVYDRTESAMATAVLFIGGRFLPAFLAPILVARVEQPPPRFALPVIYCGEAAAFAGLALFAGNNFALAVVIVLAAVDGTLALAGRALTRAVVTALLEPAGELRAGNSVLNVAFTAGAAIGPAIAGLVVAGFGAQTALLLDATSFYAVAWILLTAGPLPHAEPDPGLVRERVRAGIAYIREKATLRKLLIAQGAAFVFFSAAIPIEVVYAKQTLGASDTGYGLLLTSWGSGMVLGSFVFAAFRRASLAILFFLSTTVVGLGYLGLAASPTLGIACATAVIGGTGNGMQWVSTVSAVQELTVASMQARVMSVLESIGAAMPGIGFLLGGVLATAMSARATLLAAGLGVLVTVVLSALALGRNWSEGSEGGDRPTLDADQEIMVELIPAGGVRPPARSNSEVVS
jgi:predicted MFS family arabinose efflux permease